jgi:hypothetical protein
LEGVRTKNDEPHFPRMLASLEARLGSNLLLRTTWPEP